MKRSVSLHAFGIAIITAGLLSSGRATAQTPQAPELPNVAGHSDNVPHPLGTAQAAARERGLQAKLNGKAKGKVHQVARGQYVELSRQGEDRIWTVLGQFGGTVHPTYGGSAGPARNQIPQPNRTLDNTTIWAPDFNKGYYESMLFNPAPGEISMRNYYIEQSSNRYTVNGIVEDWVTVPFNEANYGSNYCGGIVCARTWLFVRDAVNAWYNAQVAAGKTPAEISAYLAQFDVWDRYDNDGDGNFNEPDGYIDHFQAVHAGEGEETGGGAQGEDAIWSHRWYAFYNNIGFTGPSANYLLGGIKIGGTNFWIGDYTVEPENGGVGVFAHEFGHDLGLPDLYDTSGNTGGAENSTGFWTLYSSGSYGTSGLPEDALGTKPVPMSALEKIQLDWSNYQLVPYGGKASVKLGPANFNTKQAQQLVQLLPDKKVSTPIGDAYAGTYFYHSGSGNNLDNTMARTVVLPAGTVSFSAKVRFDIEVDWDYAYLTINGTPVATNLSTNTNPNGQNAGNGITGTTNDAWVDLTADLSAFAGQSVLLGFRYWTDVAVAGEGFGIDEIAITGLATDGGETDPGWTYKGFFRSNGTVTTSHFNAYFAEFRTYLGYDDALRTSPYNFTSPTWVEHYPYQRGLLVWYYDTSFADNNVGDNCLSGRCGGLFLPVDAHPDLLMRADNRVWRPSVQTFDSTFGLTPTTPICLHRLGVETCYPSLPANPVFDDTVNYWVPPNPAIGHFGWASVPLPKFGVTFRVVSVSAHDTFMQVQVGK